MDKNKEFEDDDFFERPVSPEKIEEAFMRYGLLTNRTFGRYEILWKLAEGGMGEIYLAKDRHINQLVAFKVISGKYGQDKELLRRFKQEADAHSKLFHPNIVRILDIDNIDGIDFLVTEFVKGKTLRERLGDGLLSLPKALSFTEQIADALNFVHAQKFVHRDIKPENIMLYIDEHNEEKVKILDFGLAKLTEKTKVVAGSEDETLLREKTATGVLMGTPAYISPEQLLGKDADERSDIWSMGVVLSEMLQGRKPFSGETPLDIQAAILKSEPALADNLPSELKRIVRKALRKDPAERYQTIDNFRSDLKNLKNDEGANSFREWLSGPARTETFTLTVCVLLAMVTSVSAFFIFPAYTVSAISLIQAIVIAVAFLYFYRSEPTGLCLFEGKDKDESLNEDYRKATGYETSKDWNDAGERAETVLGSYTEYWQGLLIAWLILYVLLIFSGLPDYQLKNIIESKNEFQVAFIIFLGVCSSSINNCSAWAIFLCFNLLNTQTEIKQNKKTIKDPAFDIGFICVLAFLVVEIICVIIFWTILKDPLTTSNTLQVFSGLSGIAVGIVMALYVGRLQNKFLGPSTWVVLALYCYTAIQPLFPFLENSARGLALAAALIDFALFLKCLLFLYMAWLFQSGRLLYYLIRMRPIYQNIPDDWQKFRKILRT
jgi:serine/threonine protein kinase